MDTNLSGMVLDGATAGQLRVRGEDAYYATFSKGLRAPVWAERLISIGRRYASGAAPAGFRSIAVTGAIVFLYCVLVPLAPVLLFQAA